MPLFQQSVLRKYISELDKNILSSAWKIFQSHFHNPAMQAHIRQLKEEQYQEGFLRDLFVAVFGYSLNPQPGFNLTTEYKNEKDSKKADGAILKTDAVRAVIELKGTDTTDLSKIEGQAFGYLHNQRGCTYVITSNFEKLRFYIQDATDYLEFNLFTIGKDEFDVLFLCLQADSLLADIPQQVKQQSVTHEDAITKKLYADYSVFKHALYKDLVVNNPHNDNIELFKKSQKLLDRFLFILFAEDRLLLPPNFMVKIVEEHKQVQKLRLQQSLYERFKVYFVDLLNGNKEEDIFAYNGGLFEADEVLDNLAITDDVLQQGVLRLSQYDFNTEVDVNILGHIFEHSLNELEELQASLANTGVDKTKTRRKKEGVFYTPRYITKYIVENTIGTLCKEKKSALQINEEDYAPTVKKTKASEVQRKALVQKLDNYRAWLLELTICDPACGSGAFLNAALEFLIAEHNYVDELTNKLMGASIGFTWTPNDILEHNLFGVDINEEAVEIARLSLWLRTAQKGRKLSRLNNNIKGGNSLIDDKTIAGEQAFVWKEEFKTVFNKGGFDVIIGNPPYGSIDKKEYKDFFKKSFESFQGNFENYCFFTERFIQLAKLGNGKIGLIIPITWLTIPQFQNLRKVVLKFAINGIVELPTKIFADADLDTLICLVSKREDLAYHATAHIKVSNPNASNFEKSLNDLQYLDQSKWKADSSFKINLNTNESTDTLINRLQSSLTTVKSLFRVSQGIVPYAREEFYKRMDKEKADEIVDKRLWHSNQKLDDFFKKELKGEDVSRFSIKWNGKQWVKYGDWLARPRSREFFNGPRILVREITRGIKLNAAYTEEEFYNNPGIINIVSKANSTKLLKNLLGVLNSYLIFWYHLKNSPKANLSTSIPKILIKDIENLPIPNESVLVESTLDQEVDAITGYTYSLNIVKKNFLMLLQSKFINLYATPKLIDWWELSFQGFIKELEKQKIKLSLAEQAEWLAYFDAEKKKIIDLQQSVSQIDIEIDAKVYQLYGLTQEEISIVEKN